MVAALRRTSVRLACLRLDGVDCRSPDVAAVTVVVEPIENTIRSENLACEFLGSRKRNTVEASHRAPPVRCLRYKLSKIEGTLATRWRYDLSLPGLTGVNCETKIGCKGSVRGNLRLVRDG